MLHHGEYKLIVAGGREFTDKTLIMATLMEMFNGAFDEFTLSIVTGMAKGADKLAYDIAVDNDIPKYEFPADWDDITVPGAVVRHHKHGGTYNVIAGHQRNERMAQFADGLLAFWDGKSTGTQDMIKRMEGLGKYTKVVMY